MIWNKDISRLRQEQQAEFSITYTRVYAVPQNATLATLSIAKGDVLPAVPYAEIVDAQLGVDPNEPGRPVVSVRAHLADLWTGVSRDDDARELAYSRIMQKTADAIALIRRFEIDDSALTEGALGWTATGLPAPGDAYPSGTWAITPRVSKIDLDGSYTPSKTVVTVTYTAYLAWGDVAG